MRFRDTKLYEFLTLGRAIGFDPETLTWSIESMLVSPKGKSHRAREIVPAGQLGEIVLDASGNKYGPWRLRENIVASQHYDALGPDDILVTLGTAQAIFFTMMTQLESGDEVILEIPSWMQPHGLADAIECSTKRLQRRAERQWRIDLDELADIMTPQTKLIYLCNPNNPTGAVLTEDEMRSICNLADRYGTLVLSDEIYRGLEWSGERTPAAANLYHRAVSVSSVSKAIGMDGMRLGWLATAGRKVLEDCTAMKRLDVGSYRSCLDEAVATAALEPETYRRLVRESMHYGRINRDIVRKWAEEQELYTLVLPEAGFLSFPGYKFPMDSWTLCTELLKEPYRTYVVPGSCYEVEHHIRLGFGSEIEPAKISRGLENLSAFAHCVARGDGTVSKPVTTARPGGSP